MGSMEDRYNAMMASKEDVAQSKNLLIRCGDADCSYFFYFFIYSAICLLSFEVIGLCPRSELYKTMRQIAGLQTEIHNKFKEGTIIIPSLSYTVCFTIS